MKMTIKKRLKILKIARIIGGLFMAAGMFFALGCAGSADLYGGNFYYCILGIVLCFTLSLFGIAVYMISDAAYQTLVRSIIKAKMKHAVRHEDEPTYIHNIA